MNPIIIFAVACLVTWFFIGINARAQDRLLIAKLNGTNIGAAIVRVVWQDSNVTAVVTATNVAGPWANYLVRSDTNPISFVVTIYPPNEQQQQLFKTVPKFNGSIPEKVKP